MINQSKLRSYRTAPRYKFGFEVPRDHKHAMSIDKRNRNTKWRDSKKIEIGSPDEYETFEDLGEDGVPPEGYRKIPSHFVYDVKHDGRFKS